MIDSATTWVLSLNLDIDVVIPTSAATLLVNPIPRINACVIPTVSPICLTTSILLVATVQTLNVSKTLLIICNLLST